MQAQAGEKDFELQAVYGNVVRVTGPLGVRLLS